MAPRKKTWLESLFSFNRHRRRIAARHAASNVGEVDFEDLKRSRIEGNEPEYTHGSMPDIGEHLAQLRGEFAGRSELLFYHAKLIVLIRRESRIKENFAEFERLWMQQGAFLCEELNLRWLVSATDTFADHSGNPVARSLAMAGSLLANTAKIIEAERYLQATEEAVDKAERLAKLQSGRVPLFDGMSAFAVGTDDTLRNMRWRLDQVASLDPVGRILIEIFDRLQNLNTVYARLRARHTRKRTSWW